MILPWTALLRPASFAGVGFYVRTLKVAMGRRLIENEIPFANADYEDFGPLPQRFSVTGYVVGQNWMGQRAQLLNALQNSATPQTLVLPSFGPVTVRVGRVSISETEQVGAYSEIGIEFAQDNGAGAPMASADAASTLLNNIETSAGQVQAQYEAVMGPYLQDAAVAQYTANLLAGAASSVLALPLALLTGVNAGFAASPTDAAATGGAVTGAFLTIGDNAAAAANPMPAPATPVSGVVAPQALTADPSMGIAALLAWNAPVPVAYAADPGLSAAMGAVTRLVQQSAGLALIDFYAQTSFPNQQAAVTARGQLTGLLAPIGAAIFNAGQVDLYRAWNALSALAVQDIIQRAQGLPVLANYTVPVPVPDVVLGAELLGDGSQGDALFALNNAIHPLFMPASGYYMEPVA